MNRRTIYRTARAAFLTGTALFAVCAGTLWVMRDLNPWPRGPLDDLWMMVVALIPAGGITAMLALFAMFFTWDPPDPCHGRRCGTRASAGAVVRTRCRQRRDNGPASERDQP